MIFEKWGAGTLAAEWVMDKVSLAMFDLLGAHHGEVMGRNEALVAAESPTSQKSREVGHTINALRTISPLTRIMSVMWEHPHSSQNRA